MRESLVVNRLSDTAQNALINIVTIFLGLTVGGTMAAENFLQIETLKIILLGLVAFGFGTASGVGLGNLMCKLSKGKINPMIGAAGVSAVPMAARVVQRIGQKENPTNFLLMHAMGPNVAGVIGTAVAAGVFISLLQ
jgi:oxaloacetate decarboxylase beta subunit